MNEEFDRLASRLSAIEERNARVEAEKAWETSFFRSSVIAAIIYIVAAVVLFSVGSQNPWLNALIPAIGYILSMQSLPVIKKHWIARFRKNRK